MTWVTDFLVKVRCFLPRFFKRNERMKENQKNQDSTLTFADNLPQESEEISPLALYHTQYPVHVTLQQPPGVMEGYHWHGHMEINIPFGDVEYIFNGKNIPIKAGHIALFWASVPHRLVDCQACSAMAVLDIPVHLFLSWSLPNKLINQITHGMILQSNQADLVGRFEIERWQKELQLADSNRQQLVYNEIQLMIKRMSFDGWQALASGAEYNKQENNNSRHQLNYVSLMLNHIATHYSQALTAADIASAVGLNPNYAMGLFKKTMQLTIKQYIIMMRINHAKALLSDTDKSMLDISLSSGFNALSRFYDNFQKQVGTSPQNYRKFCRSNQHWHTQGFSPIKGKIKGASDGLQLLL